MPVTVAPPQKEAFAAVWLALFPGSVRPSLTEPIVLWSQNIQRVLKGDRETPAAPPHPLPQGRLQHRQDCCVPRDQFPSSKA